MIELIRKNKLTKKTIVILIMILFFAGFLRVYRLGVQSFIADEYLGIDISYGYHQSGSWNVWDFNDERITDQQYTRGQIYYWQVAQLFKFFEPTEAFSRLISVMWGMIAIVALFFGSLYVTKKPKIALISALLLAVSVAALIYDRKLRMYSMFAPLFFMFSYLIYATIELIPKKKGMINSYSMKLGLNLYLLPLALLVGYLCLKTHLLTVNIVPIIFSYLLIIAIWEYKKRRNLKNKYVIFLLAGIVFSFAGYNFGTVQGALNFFNPIKFNWSYIEKIVFDYSYFMLSLSIILIGAGYLIKKHGKIGLWTVLNLLVPLLLAIFVWDRNAGLQYIHFTHLFKVMIVASGIYLIAVTFSKCLKYRNSTNWLIAYLIVILINIPFFFSERGFYGEPKTWGYPNYREAFEYFLQNKNENDALISRSSYNYYLSATDTDFFPYGSNENKLDKVDIEKVQQSHDVVWVISSDDDFNLRSDAKSYIKENFELIKTKYTNKQINIWRWEKNSR